MPGPTPSDYEQAALGAIQAWKRPAPTRWDRAMKLLHKPIDAAGDVAMKALGVEWIIEKAFGGFIGLLGDGAALTVRPRAILAEFEPPVGSLAELAAVDLENADRAIGFLATKYKSLALAGGAAAGAAGMAGPVVGGAAIAADVTALLTLNLRAVGEYATYYGFDMSRQEERLFALNVLGLASSPSDAAKAVAMSQLVKIARLVAQKKTWRELEKHVFVQIAQRIAKALAIRLTKAKLAQVIPAAGAVLGGGFNAHYTARVCDAAYFLYRERFLARKYGAELIEATAAEPSDFGKGYETA
ncbi:EcsC family protein [Melittangium boletus]|uniref:EcsC family protein n=1 Tax=Melittangium boletus TaxID=83453 RepID=UPI003DA560F5